jgi:hypothetical protein
VSEPNAVENPYAAPGADEGDAVRAAGASWVDGYRGQAALVGVLMIVLGLQALMHGFNAASCAYLLTAPARALQHQLVVVTNAVAQAARALYFLGVIPFAMFLVRANTNARALAYAQSEETRSFEPVFQYTPASMVWWFAIPIFNLFRPYQAMQAVWAASAPEVGSLASATGGSIVSLWWGAYLARNVAITVLSMSAVGGRPDPVAHNILATFTGLAGVASCLAAFRLIQALERRQALCATSRSSGS